MYFEQNAAALLEKDPETAALVEAVRRAAPVGDDDLLLMPSEDGQCAFRYRGIWLHEVKSPLEEARRAFDAGCQVRDDRVHLLLGLGLGYGLDEAVRRSKTESIIVYEPDLSLLRFAFENVDLQELLANPRVQLATSFYELTVQLNPYIYAYFDPDFMLLPGSAQRFAADLPLIAGKIKDMMTDWVRNYQTTRRFHFQWLRQFFQNVPKLVASGGLESLAGRFAGKPAIIVSRGPSLDPALPGIEALSDAAVLVSVGSALRHLWQAGLTPDFAVFVDANGLDEQLYGLPEDYLSQIVFVMGPYTQTHIFDAPARAKLSFFLRGAREISQWANEALKTEHLFINGGGTVSTFALQLALALGCTEVVLTGQDLAMPNNQVYAGGIALKVNEQGMMALEGSETLYVEPEPMSTILGQDGTVMPTLNAYVTYARQFSLIAGQVAASSPQTRLYNASLGGAQIDGYEVRPIESFKSVWPDWKNGQPALTECPAQGVVEQESRRQNLRKALELLKQELRQTATFCQKQITLLNGTKQASLNPAQLQKLEETVWTAIQQVILHLQSRPFVNFCVTYELLPCKQRLKAMRDAASFNPVVAQDLTSSLKQLVEAIETRYNVWVQEALDQVASSVVVSQR